MTSIAEAPNKIPAILLITFNRAEQTAQVLEAIRAVKPSVLYVANDGPRPGRSDDTENVRAVRDLISDINWCDSIHTRFQSSNLGCGRAVSQAISWFLHEAGEGIILEDDCLPDSSFFRFCAEMLDRYRNVSNVMQISGYNLIADKYPLESDYLLSNFGWIWGWATWRRAWDKFDLSMSSWPKFKELGLHRHFPFYPERTRTFDATHSGEINTWDYQWHYAIVSNSGLSVVPRVNLVRNIGFGDGTHSKNVEGYERYSIPARHMRFPLHHCEFVCPDRQYDKLLIQEAHRRTLLEKVRIVLSLLYRSVKHRREVRQ